MISYLFVGAGGALGAMGRYWLGSVGANWGGTFPTATFLANILGGLLMGVFVGLLARFTPAFQEELRLFFAVGVLGGFTTFSAFSLESWQMIARGQYGVAVFYGVMSVFLSVAALAAGLLLVRGGNL